MWKDPIVDETRKAGEQFSDESGGNIQIFFSNLRLKQEKYAERFAAKVPSKIRVIQHKNNSLTA